MAIEKYTTKAIVLEWYDQGEHDRVFKVFTREFGLLMCHAKSVRKLESKLRAHLLPRSVSLITLVQGKEVWRLVGAEHEHVASPYIHDVVQLLKRFVRGEGEHTFLYDRLTEFLTCNHVYDEQTTRLLLYFMMLTELGYADAKVLGVTSHKDYSELQIEDLYTHLLLTKQQVRKHIQEVLLEMHL